MNHTSTTQTAETVWIMDDLTLTSSQIAHIKAELEAFDDESMLPVSDPDPEELQ